MANDYAKHCRTHHYLHYTYKEYSCIQLWPNIPAAVLKYKAVRSITTGSLRSMLQVVALKALFLLDLYANFQLMCKGFVVLLL